MIFSLSSEIRSYNWQRTTQPHSTMSTNGGTHSLSLLYLAVDLWERCYQHHIFPIVAHISTEDNYLADHLSYMSSRMHEWSFNDTVQLLCHCLGTPTIDIFARLNGKCSIYFWAGADNSSIGDIYMINWSWEFLYLFIQWVISGFDSPDWMGSS